MTFAFIPKAAYTIGQIIYVHGAPMRVESYTHSGRNLEAVTLPRGDGMRTATLMLAALMLAGLLAGALHYFGVLMP